MAESIRAIAGHFCLSVVGPLGCESALPNGVSGVGIPVRPLAGFLVKALTMSIAESQRHPSDLVFSGSGLTAPLALMVAQRRRVPMVTWLHGLDIVVDNMLYQATFVRTFRYAKMVIANSNNTAHLAERYGIPRERIRVVHPCIAPVTALNGDSTRFRKRFGLDGTHILLCVGRLTPRKGIVEFIEKSFPRLVQKIPNVHFVVIGDDPTDAAARTAGVRARLNAAIDRNRLGRHVSLLGSVSDALLCDAFAAASIHLFPSVSVHGDVEGFGMVAVEAAAQGVPTIGFRAGGVPDAVEDGVSGWLLEQGDYDGMSERIEQYLAAPLKSTVSASLCRRHAERFSFEAFSEKLVMCLTDVLVRQ